MKKILACLTTIFLLAGFLSTTAYAEGMSSTSYRIPTSVFSGGGGPMTSASYRMTGTIGQATPIMEQGMDPFSDNYGLLPGFWYTIGPFSATCPGDFDWDFDVDGSDLQEFIHDADGLGLDDFAANFGTERCR